MPRRPVAHTRPTGSAFFLRCLTFLSLLIIGIPTSSSAFGELPAKRLEVAEVEAPFRFLLIPVKGLVGVNVTSGGVDEAINLAKSQGWEGVIFELDATMGLLDEGLAIAGRIRQAAADLRTIALVRRVGGAGIPILFACEEWLVFDKIDIEEQGEHGATITSAAGPDRAVIQTLPTWGGTADSVAADLSALRTATRRSMPASTSTATRNARAALLDALVNPALDLRVGTDGELSTTPRLRGEGMPANVIPTSEFGPGINAIDLEATKLSMTVPVGLDPLREALGVESVEPQGDPGILLISADAEELGNRRGVLGNRIDGLFSGIDAIDSLAASLPWSTERARLVDPTSTQFRDRFPMIYADGQWTLSANGLKAWTAACDRGIRRWSGVGITLREMNALVVHVEGLLQEIQAFVPIPEDLPRHGTAIRVAEPILAEIRTNLPTWETDRVNAAAEVTRLKRLKAEPPTASP
jgi:hypothetical protein